MTVVILVGTYWFDVAIAGSVLLLFALTGLFTLTCLGMGLVVSAISNTQQQASMAGQFVILPNMFFSGFMFPIASMPVGVQYLTYLIPLRYYITVVRGIFLKGVGWAELRDEAAIMLVYGVIIMGLATTSSASRSGKIDYTGGTRPPGALGRWNATRPPACPEVTRHRSRSRTLDNAAIAPVHSWVLPGAVPTFPGRLHHTVPPWVPLGSCFHIRVRCRKDNPVPLIAPRLGTKLLVSVRLYTQLGRWWPHLFLLMPDHWHALLCFPAEESMSGVIGDWKRFHTRLHGVRWQDNYFDHRLRHDESLEEKAHYIRNNPVVKRLCKRPEDWRWVIAADSE